jgi:tetratricopeptide (TPR) repeat protein/energy-coupling factor transporter ATP-binding protein EcfA2
MNQQPNPGQNFDSNDSSFSEAQIGQAGGHLSQVQNINTFSVMNLAGLLRRREINTSNQQDYNSRNILLNRVKQYWITQVLENSLHSKALVELGLEERLDAVKRPSEIAQEDNRNLRQLLPQDKNNIDVFREMPKGRTLLVLGEPGAGKTTFMLRIAKNLIADTELNLSLPIPVIFNLSSWATKRQNIAQWLIQELNNNYKVSKSLAKIWIQNQQLLLMLDGLDEVKAEYRDACVKALNEFMRNYGETEIVVCSRVKDYEFLTNRNNRLAIQRGVCIQSLTTEQIHNYLDRAGTQLQAVKTLLETDTALQELVKSPLILSILTFAYRDVAIEDLPKVDSIEEHRQYLFDKYIQRMFQRRGANKTYSEEKARNWLSWLAYKMSQNSQTIFSIEQMQPRWLANSWQKLIYRIGIIICSSLIFAGLFTFIKFLSDIPESASIQEVVKNLYNSFSLPSLILGCILGFIGVINNLFSNKEEIILPIERWRLSKEKVFEGFINGIRIGIICGTIIGIFFIIFGLLAPIFDWSLEQDSIFSDRFIGFFISLAYGILFTSLFQINKKIFSFSKNKFKTNFFKNYFSFNLFKRYIKNTFFKGICVGILIWIATLFLPNELINFIIQCIYISFIFIGFCSLFFGIIGVFLGSRDSIDVQKNVISINYLRQALVNTASSGLFGSILGALLGGILYILVNLKSGNPDIEYIFTLGYFFGICFGFVTGFACIKHLVLRLILYRYNYIAWNYTHFLEYSTERIFLQKVGGGYIFVHRLLLEHFAALYQTPQQSLATRSNLSRLRKRKVFSLLLIGTTILITLLGYSFRKEWEKSVQNFVQYIDDPNRKIDYYTQQIQQNPKNAENYDERGDAYEEKGEYDLAITDYSQAIQLDSEYKHAYTGRGDAYEEKGEYNLAIADYNKAIELDPNYTYAYRKRGDAYEEKGEYNLAIADYNKAIELDPKYTYAYYSRGNAYYNKKEYNLAIADYNKVIELDDKDIYAYYNRGLAYKNKGIKEKAIRDFQKVIELNKNNPQNRELFQQAKKLIKSFDEK